MAELDKVIKGLERCKLYNKLNCDKCPYDYNGRGNGKSECTAELASDVLELLKEQEAKPVEICGRLSMLKYGNCPRCGKYMNSEVYPHWCGFCGQAVKWE